MSGNGRFPPGMQVIERDWLNANHVLLLGEDAVLIDSGHVCGLETTRREIARRLGGRRLDVLANTHCHSDHMGGNAALRREHGCKVLIPDGEVERVRDWDTRALWLDYAGQRAERFDFDAAIAAGTTLRWGGLDWHALPAAGHDDGALMFYCPTEDILISGDALWARGFGVVRADPPEGLEAARRTLQSIAGLEVRLVVPGHGAPFTDVGVALDACFARLDALESDPRRLARSVLKTMLSFSLLERGPMAEAAVRALIQGAPIYTEYNERFLHLPAQRLFDTLVRELERAGALVRSDGMLRAVA